MKAHLFVCTNTKREGDSCGPKGGGALKDATKAMCGQNLAEHRGGFRVNASGCLGRCAEGIAAVLYPQGTWFTGLSAEDAPKLADAVATALKTEK